MIITPDYYGHCHSKKADLRCCHTKKLTLDVWVVGLGECVCVCVGGGGGHQPGVCAPLKALFVVAHFLSGDKLWVGRYM